jgi:nicotinate-nucleotide pyrophosphorylase (carboxylating)
VKEYCFVLRIFQDEVDEVSPESQRSLKFVIIDDMQIEKEIQRFIEMALQEDIGTGDVTTEATIDVERTSKAHLVVKNDMVLAGVDVAARVFHTLDDSVSFTAMAVDGARLQEGEVIALIKGNSRSILKAERVALNILQRMSGTATLTRKFVDKLAGLNTKILDTRKTTPLMRTLEKYSVLMGGAENHRVGLYDMVLIKDNHIKASGGITLAVKKAREAQPELRVEVEAETLRDVKDALAAGADIIMLDNMMLDTMLEAVELVAGAALLEASGNVSLDNVRAIAETGVDYISVGALTHSAPAADISLKFEDF